LLTAKEKEKGEPSKPCVGRAISLLVLTSDASVSIGYQTRLEEDEGGRRNGGSWQRNDFRLLEVLNCSALCV